MKTLYHIVLAALSISLFLVGSSEARTVYLKDGAQLQAEVVRRSNGRVIVLVNHEMELILSEGEVNLQKTFPKHGVRKKSPHRVQQAVKAPVMTRLSSAQAPVSGQNPATKPPTSAKVVSAGPVTASPAAGQAPAAGKPSPSVNVPPSLPTPSAATPSAVTPSPDKHPLPGSAETIKTLSAVPKTTIFGIVAGVLLLIILMVVSLWKVYEKAGQAGWKSLIPIYNYVVFLNIIDKPVWWIILLFVPLVSVVVLIIMHIELAKRFGKGVLYGLGLCFLPIIFFPLLAFGDATYD
jgi:hypothetical protein